MNSQLTKGIGRMTKLGVAGVLAAVWMFAPAAANGQEKAPEFSVFRKGVGVLSAAAKKRSVQLEAVEGSMPVSGDFDGDGRIDTGLFDPANRIWSVRRSSDNTSYTVSISGTKKTAQVRPEPAPADVDGDGQDDVMVFCAGAWHVVRSTKPGSQETWIFGRAGDVPVPADYDGDGQADLAVFRPSENRWHIRSSTTGEVSTADFGIAGTDVLIPADFSGDGKADLAVYRRGVWHMIDSETGVEETFDFGFEDGLPAAGDFNRDGQMDYAVCRKGNWFVYDGSSLASYRFGSDEDVPLGKVPARASMPGM